MAGSQKRNPPMHGRGESDRSVVPTKPPNKAGEPVAEAVEGRERTKGNPNPRSTPQAQDWKQGVSQARARVREVASKDKQMRFTTLQHHIYHIDALRSAYFGLKKAAAAGVDGETWTSYGRALEEHLQDLSGRIKRGAYRALPVRRVYIAKEDGRQRPLGVTALEDKIVQAATVAVLNAIYETDFLGFSYGFRPGRGQHDALDALAVGLAQRKVNWVLDADIRGFFDAIDHECLMQLLEYRIGDERVLRLIRKWLQAGVLEEGVRHEVEQGTPQGGVISPLLANIYLHYAFDVWVQAWRQATARGEMIVVRYADDFVVGFEHRADAERYLVELKARLSTFGLELHPDKTRLIEFGRYASERRGKRGQGKPETFDFLGFTHCCGKSRTGGFVVKRRTMPKRLRRKLKAISQELWRRLHDPVREVAAWLGKVVVGHMRYYGVPFNYPSIARFRLEVIWRWRRVLSRRSQKGSYPWPRMRALVAASLPPARLFHPFPSQRLRVTTRGRSPVR